jgi:hypothetical protein
MSMEYRSWIEIPGLAYVQEAEHERLFRTLLRDHVDLGPVMSWTDDGATTLVVLSVDGASRSAAITKMEQAVASSLRSSGLGHLAATASATEPAIDDAAAATA